MKFGHSLRFNCLPEWSEFYISYDMLKRSIYSIQNALHHIQKPLPSAKYESYIQLISEDNSDNTQFIQDLEMYFVELYEKELQKVSKFYCKVEDTMGSLLNAYLREEATNEDKIVDLYIGLNNLKEFLYLNNTGFVKIIKKHEKYGWLLIRDKLEILLKSYIDLHRVVYLEELLGQVEIMHATRYGDLSQSKEFLRHHLKEHIVYERNIIWKEMIEGERKIYNTHLESYRQHSFMSNNLKGNISLFVKISCAILIFWAGWFALSPIQDNSSKISIQSCFALICLVISLWCFEIFPMFITALLIPFCGSFLPIFHSNNQIVSPIESSSIIFHSMFSHVIMVLLGSFTTAAIISKHGIAKRITHKILSSLKQPTQELFLLVMMSLSCFLSIFVSNVASPILCFSIVQPILRSFEMEEAFPRALILAICFGANIGGISSPISSPQNIFAIEELWKDKISIGWIEWMTYSIPVCILSIFFTWKFLSNVYGISKKTGHSITFPRWTVEEWSKNQIVVIILFIFSFLTWIFHPLSRKFIGQMGTLSIIPIFLFFGFGFLSKDDFNSFPWHIIMLSMCGLALGECIKGSGLLKFIAENASKCLIFMTKFMPVQLFVAAIFTMTISMIVSHTVCSIILLPIIHGIVHVVWSENLKICKLFVIVCSFSCSFGIGFPFSSFPNLAAISLETPTGQLYLGSKEFCKRALFVSITTTLISIIWCLVVFMWK